MKSFEDPFIISFENFRSFEVPIMVAYIIFGIHIYNPSFFFPFLRAVPQFIQLSFLVYGYVKCELK